MLGDESHINHPGTSKFRTEKDTAIKQKIDAITTQRDPCLGQKTSIMMQLRYVARCGVRREQTEQCGWANFKATRMQGSMQKGT